jgi:formate dehydrogenase major subunit
MSIESRRGRIVVEVRLDDSIPAGAVFLPFCFVEAPANVLTSPELDPFGKIPEFKYSAVRLARAPLGVQPAGAGAAPG